MKTTANGLGGTVFESFGLIDDPRAGNAAHSLESVLFCLIVAVICGADGFVQAEHYARLKKAFIKKYVDLPRGVPTHDTMARVLAVVQPEQFASAFAAFIEKLTGFSSREVFNLDGKTLRGVVGTAALKRSHSDAANKQVQIVSLFSTMREIVVGQLKTQKSVNEVKAAQELLQIIDIKGGVVTMDALHVIRRTLEIIEEQGADAVVTVKANASGIHKAMTRAFRAKPVATTKTEERRGEVVERRVYEIFPAGPNNFPTIKAFVRVTRDNVSHSGKKRQRQRRITRYATTLSPRESARIAEVIRGRWAIENKLHYILDVTFAEDHSRIRVKNCAENFSRLRHIAYNLLRLLKTPKKLSFELKRASAAMDDRFLARLLKLPPR